MEDKKFTKKPFLLKKPPLGLIPQFIYEEDRILKMITMDKVRLRDIRDAKTRYKTAKVKPPADWTTQQRSLRRRIKRLSKKWVTNRQSTARLNPNKLDG